MPSPGLFRCPHGPRVHLYECPFAIGPVLGDSGCALGGPLLAYLSIGHVSVFSDLRPVALCVYRNVSERCPLIGAAAAAGVSPPMRNVSKLAGLSPANYLGAKRQIRVARHIAGVPSSVALPLVTEVAGTGMLPC
jgi:hypothetical protein